MTITPRAALRAMHSTFQQSNTEVQVSQDLIDKVDQLQRVLALLCDFCRECETRIMSRISACYSRTKVPHVSKTIEALQLSLRDPSTLAKPETLKSLRLIVCLVLGSWSHSNISRFLGLDIWTSTGRRAEACARIIGCLREKRTRLDLSNLGLSSLPENALSYLSLTELHCGGNAWTTLSLTQLPTLERLYCTNGPLSTSQLTQQNESDVPIRQPMEFFFAELPALESIVCSASELASRAFLTLPALKMITCSETQCGHKINLFSLPRVPDSLMQLPRHCTVDLSRCEIPEVEVQRVRDRLISLRDISSSVGPTIHMKTAAEREFASTTENVL